MRLHHLITAAGTLALSVGLTPRTRSVQQPLTLQPQSRLWIEGTSTVRAFQCRAGTLETDVQVTGPGAVRAVIAGEKAVSSAQVRVPARSLDCRNGTMNEHMYKAVKAAEHATIAFTVTSYEISRAADSVKGSATGQLSLGGVERTITVTGDVTEQADGALHIRGAHRLRMTEYGLKPPTLMMGVLKVHDGVTVGFDLLLKE